MVLAASGPLLTPPPPSPPKTPIQETVPETGTSIGTACPPAQKGLPSREVAVQLVLGPEGFRLSGD